MGARHWVAGDRNDLGNDAGSSSLDAAGVRVQREGRGARGEGARV